MRRANTPPTVHTQEGGDFSHAEKHKFGCLTKHTSSPPTAYGRSIAIEDLKTCSREVVDRLEVDAWDYNKELVVQTSNNSVSGVFTVQLLHV